MWGWGNGDLYWRDEHPLRADDTSRTAQSHWIHGFDVGSRYSVSKKLTSRVPIVVDSHSLGPILGGAFVNSSATWRWSFYINLCVGAAVSPAWIFLLPSHHPRPDLTPRDRIASIDWVGVILYLGASLSASMDILFGGALYAWGSGHHWPFCLWWCPLHPVRHSAGHTYIDEPRGPDLPLGLRDKLGNVRLLRRYCSCQHSQLRTYLFHATVFPVRTQYLRLARRRIPLTIRCFFRHRNSF